MPIVGALVVKALYLGSTLGPLNFGNFHLASCELWVVWVVAFRCFILMFVAAAHPALPPPRPPPPFPVPPLHPSPPFPTLTREVMRAILRVDVWFYIEMVLWPLLRSFGLTSMSFGLTSAHLATASLPG